MMESDIGSERFQSFANGEDLLCPTPEEKLGLQKAASDGDMLNLTLSSGSVSSDLSPRAGSALSSSLSPPSESESDPEFFSIRRVVHEHDDDSIEFGSKFEKRKGDMYNSLLEKVSKYEEELEFAYKVIMTSQEEISRLRSELQRSPTSTGVSKNSCEELQNTIARLEDSLQDSDQSNAVLTEELRGTKERLQTCENELKNKTYEVNHEMQQKINSTNEVVGCLETELASERWTVSELQARVDAIQAVNLALSTAHTNERLALQSKLDEAESRVKLLEDQVGQSILEKLEIRDTLEAEEKQFQADINQLKTELTQRNEQINALNKTLDASKLKYDMLMAEKDELTAKLQSLNCVSMRLTELDAERLQLLGKLEDGERMRDELRLKVTNLEKEAAVQKDVIFERDEEKREAIRQLCFSLDYYRSEYYQLCSDFTGLKRHSLR